LLNTQINKIKAQN
jgi:hypothetical protein